METIMNGNLRATNIKLNEIEEISYLKSRVDKGKGIFKIE